MKLDSRGPTLGAAAPTPSGSPRVQPCQGGELWARQVDSSGNCGNINAEGSLLLPFVGI
jgi:hypothetical protein